MKLYHHTALSTANSILTNSLEKGHMTTPYGDPVKDVVWLTSDPSWEGHGLLTGKEFLNQEKIDYLKKIEKHSKNIKTTLNKTNIRLTYDLPDSWNKNIQKYVEYCKDRNYGDFAKLMGLSCYFELENLSPVHIKNLMQTTKTKEDTWWISFIPIPSDFVSAVDFNQNNNFIPYCFEKHGRTELSKYGFFSPSPDALQELRNIFSPRFAFDNIDALVIAPNDLLLPFVTIRGEGNAYIVKIEDSDILHGPIKHSNKIQEWVFKNKTQLLECWGLAKKSHDEYHNIINF